jgi:hypothetical protein
MFGPFRLVVWVVLLQQYQLYRTHLLDIRRGSYEHTKQCIEKFILLGQPDRAVQLLLETEPSNDAFYCDSLKYDRLSLF